MGRATTRLLTEARYSLRLFFRNPQAMFFSFLFPVLFMIALGFLLSRQDDDGQIRYLLPGIIGMSVMFSAISGTTGTIVKYRANGVFRKIATTPLTGFELNTSRIATGTLIVLLSAMITLLMTWLVFGVMPAVNIVSLLVLIVGSITFVCLGMVIAYLLEDTDSVNAVTYVVVIPLILLSGSLFPVVRLPDFLQFVSVFSPLTYLNDGLRNAMFGGSARDAIVDTGVCCFLCLMLFCTGVAILMGKEEG
ncbi:MAG: ABC transporter permease [Methanocella sp.]